MEDKNTSTLPPVQSSSDNSQSGSIQQISGGPEIVLGPSSKDIMIGFGLLLLLTLLFFFIQSAFVKYLVGEPLKRSPNNAGLAGWGLFGGLFFAATLGCIALFGKILLTAMIIVPLTLFSLICFVLAIVLALKK
ncbi:MAG: hypothetical protein WCI81_01100 [Chlorobiaceae bacterium]